jgi:hypothetical protein
MQMVRNCRILNMPMELINDTKFSSPGYVQPCPIPIHVPPHLPQKTYALQSYHMYLHFTLLVTKKTPKKLPYESTRPASNNVCAMPKNLFKSWFWYQIATKELLSRDMLLLYLTHNFRAAYVFFLPLPVSYVYN